ncbi:MAG TPA: YbaY family lipoprotein [Phycisphaerales bacterium]|nr:YbaY family lipoprotein [Phycisphaerales bacterium]
MYSRLLHCIVVITFLSAVIGCSSSTRTRSNYRDGVKVSGVITYREKAALPPNAVVTARLVDITQPAAPMLLREVIITKPGQVPVPFVMTADPGSINQNHNYAVEATIKSGHNVMWRTTQQYGVITRGNPTNGLMVWVQRVDEE